MGPGLWSNNLLDADAALLDICDACVKAGPIACQMYEISAELVLQRINRLLDKLKVAPIPAYLYPRMYGIVGYNLVKAMLFLTLYSTHSDGAYVINKLSFFERGDGLILPPVSQLFRELLSCDCPAPENELPFYGLWELEHGLAVACGDNEIEDESFAEVQAVYKNIEKTSSFADAWGVHVACS